jgi:hypothetical protein
MFDVNAAAVAGLVLGGIFGAAIVVLLGIAWYQGPLENRHIWKLASRATLFVFAIIVLSLVQSDEVSSPCFYGFTRGVPDSAACEFGVGLAAVTIVVIAFSFLLWFSAKESLGTIFVLFDVGMLYALACTWLALAIYLATQLAARRTRCVTDDCGADSSYVRAIAAVEFAFLAAAMAAVAVPEAYR